MKKKQKKKISKYKIRRIIAIIFIIVVIFGFKYLTSILGDKDKRPELSILLNNELLTPEKEVIIDDVQNIYFSKEDVHSIFDQMIYYNDAEKELITTYNTHTALLKIDENNILINDNQVPLNGKLQEINNTVYLPIKDLQTVYDIEVIYLQENNRIIIDSLLKEKKQATVTKDVKVKSKKGLLKKTVEKINAGEKVIILETDKSYKKIRTSLGNIGYIKDKKITNESNVRETQKKQIYDLNVYKEYSNISGIYENITVDKEKLNVVIPTFFYLGKNSKLLNKTASTTATYANYTNWLNQNNLEILPTLENNECVCSTLLTYSQRSELINSLCTEIIKYQYKGININFKDIDDINSFYRFVIELTPRFKENGLIVCVTINDEIDKEKILKITDYIIEK